jgi:hypothetical protein
MLEHVLGSPVGTAGHRHAGSEIASQRQRPPLPSISPAANRPDRDICRGGAEPFVRLVRFFGS